MLITVKNYKPNWIFGRSRHWNSDTARQFVRPSSGDDLDLQFFYSFIMPRLVLAKVCTLWVVSSRIIVITTHDRSNNCSEGVRSLPSLPFPSLPFPFLSFPSPHLPSPSFPSHPFPSPTSKGGERRGQQGECNLPFLSPPLPVHSLPLEEGPLIQRCISSPSGNWIWHILADIWWQQF